MGGYDPIVTSMSPHFPVMWKRRRCGTPPNLETLNRLIREGTQIREQRTLWELDAAGKPVRKVKQLDEYWNAKVNVIILVDGRCKKAVTVITEKEGIRVSRRRCV